MTGAPPSNPNSISTVYVVEPENQGWIIEHLMRDIAVQLEGMGVKTRFGPADGYDGEDVLFNSRYLTPVSSDRARVNSLFITHIDDRIKELELRSRLERFNSLVCMSRQEADFVAGLAKDHAGVIGIELPARDLTVAPIRLALFTARYEDGRKNERWLLEYFASRSDEHRQNFVVCLMGWGWESFSAELSALDMNYEIYRYSRQTPGEYAMYKSRLATMDQLAYLGFDGGAMCVYDAVSAGVDVIATDISYHRGLGETVSLIANKQDFFAQMDRLHERNLGRKTALRDRSATEYSRRLLAHWNRLVNGLGEADDPAAERLQAQAAAVDLFRSHYKPIGLSRLRSFAIRLLQVLRLR
jgi:hypothetical protein